jgi:hypothetical protein
VAVDLKWVVELGDKVTKPARDMVTGVTSFQESLKKADKALDGLAGGKVAKVGDAIIDKLKGGFASAGAAALSFGASASAELAKLAVEAGKFALEDIIAGEDLDLAMKTAIGDAKEFAKAKKDITDLGNFLGKDPDEVQKQLTKLVSKGHDVAEAMSIIQGAADLKVLGNDANALVDAFTAVDDKGKLASKAVAALSGAGLDPKKFREILGSAIGSSGDLQIDIENAIKAGTLDTATLQAAALGTITQMTGKALGGLAEEQSHTIGGLLNTLKTVPGRMMDALDTDGLAEPLRRALTAITDALNPESESGAKVAKGLQKIADAVGRVIDMATGDGGDIGDFVVGLADVFSTVADVVVVVSDLVSDFIDEFKTGLDAILKPMGDFGGEAVSMDDVIAALSKTFKFLGAVIGVTVGLVIQVASWIIEAVVGIGKAAGEFVDWWDHLWRHDVPDAASEAVDMVVDYFDGLVDSLDDMVSDFTDFGTNIVDGIIDGIKAAWSGFKTMWNKLIEGLARDRPHEARDPLAFRRDGGPHGLHGRRPREGRERQRGQGARRRWRRSSSLRRLRFSRRNAGPSASIATGGRTFNFYGNIIVQGSNAKEQAMDLLDQVRRIIEAEEGGIAATVGAAA